MVVVACYSSYNNCDIFLPDRIDGIIAPLYNPYLSDDTPEDTHSYITTRQNSYNNPCTRSSVKPWHCCSSHDNNIVKMR